MKPGSVIILLIVILSLSATSTMANVSSTSQVDSVSVVIEYRNGTVQDFDNAIGETVYNATESVVEIKARWFGNLAYVYSINGVEEDTNEGYYWQYWVDGNYATLAANLFMLDGNETIEWKLTSSIITPTTTNLDETLFLGILGVSVLGIVILSVLYWLGHRRKKQHETNK